MKYFWSCILVCLVQLSCSNSLDQPKAPSIKGVFIGDKTIPSAFTDKQVVYSMLNTSDKSSGTGLAYSKYATGTEILVEGKKYKFYINTLRNSFASIDFWIKEKGKDAWPLWFYHTRFKQALQANCLAFDAYGLSRNSYIDSIPPKMYGYCDELNARAFLAIVSSPEMITKSYYLPLLMKHLNEDKAKSRESGILNDFFERGFDPRTQKFISEDSLLSEENKKKKILEIGVRVSEMYKKEAYEKTVEDFYFKHSGATNYAYVTEWCIQPGDSVWFTGRISGDSVIAFFKRE